MRKKILSILLILVMTFVGVMPAFGSEGSTGVFLEEEEADGGEETALAGAALSGKCGKKATWKMEKTKTVKKEETDVRIYRR